MSESAPAQRLAVGISVGLVAVMGAGFGRVAQGSASKALAVGRTEHTIETALHQRLQAFGADRPLSVRCPRVPAKTGWVFTCSVSGVAETPFLIQVTETAVTNQFRLAPAHH